MNPAGRMGPEAWQAPSGFVFLAVFFRPDRSYNFTCEDFELQALKKRDGYPH